ncbi:Tetratricopeptide repeat protein 29 [Triplophysa tibetana]|uniref:Tetratricopeptide repeat protein 29 n=1 Tax=Triplophysa tibetana TaxID=1572043 RepID=A0A5A9MYR7_9TELE|nr:Tetratricopeptide repeat protein 29 [Triplophysa tibetana]
MVTDQLPVEIYPLCLAHTGNPEQKRKPLRQNICTGLLSTGFHRSFAQLFALLQRWDEAELHPHKLETLQSFLARTETAERGGQYEEMYDNHLCLARFFTEPEDEWLKHNFFQLALQSARKLKIDSGKREAESNLHIGQIYLMKGQLELAQDHYEEFYHMTLGREWQDTSGCTHHERSCEELGRVYTLLAERLLQKQDFELAVKMLTKAYEMAKESGDAGPKGKAAYRLGIAYQSIGDHTTAIQFLSVYKDISTARGDMDNLGKAYGAIANSLERQMQYDESYVYLKRAYEIACNMASVSRLQKAQLRVGTSHALSMLQAYYKHIEMSRWHSIQKIIVWKEKRQGNFVEPIQTPLDQKLFQGASARDMEHSPDTHEHCIACLGPAHAEAAFCESDHAHCADLPARVLRTRRNIARGIIGSRLTATNESLVSLPIPGGAATTPSRRPLPSPHSPFLYSDESLCPPPSVAGAVSFGAEEDNDSMSISASDKDWAGSERDRPDLDSAPGPPRGVHKGPREGRQRARCSDITWSSPEEPVKSKLDSWYLQAGRHQATSKRNAPFFPDVHDHVVKLWSAPQDARPKQWSGPLKKRYGPKRGPPCHDGGASSSAKP